MFKIDNCEYCSSVTFVNYQELSDLLIDIERGDVGCLLCMDGEGEHHSEFDIYDDDNTKIWCGHKQRCKNLSNESDSE